MRKTEVVHIRVTPDLKRRCESIFQDLGVNLSYAVSMFFNQVIKRNGFPFEIVNEPSEEKTREEKIAEAISLTAAGEPKNKVKKIIHLYAKGDIDYDTACFAIKKEFK